MRLLTIPVLFGIMLLGIIQWIFGYNESKN